MRNSRRCLIIAAGVIVSGIADQFMLAPSVNAICDEPSVLYEFPNSRKSQILSNLRSDWAEGGTTINYTKNTTATADASVTASVSAEAGVVFAKASTSLGVTVGTSWSKSDSWSYSKTVPEGKEGRLVMYRESREFTVVKKVRQYPCNYKAVYSDQANAPLKSGSNVWRLQLRKPGARQLDQKYEEIDVTTEKNVEGDIKQ